MVKSEERMEEYWRTVLGTKAGRAVMRDLLGVCNFGKSPFNENVNTMAMISGKQLVGEEIMSQINKADAYFLSIKEAKEDDQHDRSDNPDDTRYHGYDSSSPYDGPG